MRHMTQAKKLNMLPRSALCLLVRFRPLLVSPLLVAHWA
jgi:hypothetical protein